MNEKFEETLRGHLEDYLKRHRNDPFRYIGPPKREDVVQLLILQKLIEISHDLAAIRESLALQETEDWTQSS